MLHVLLCSILCPSLVLAIVFIGKRGSWLLYFVCLPGVLYTVIVLWLFLEVPWVGLQCVTVLFPHHIHLLLPIIDLY